MSLKVFILEQNYINVLQHRFKTCFCYNLDCKEKIHILSTIIPNDKRSIEFCTLTIEDLIYLKRHLQDKEKVNSICDVCGKDTSIHTINIGKASDEGYKTFTHCQCNN